jgi:Zn-dependent protease
VFNIGPEMLYLIPALLIGLTVHEYSHARMAVYLGDNTPRAAGRLTLNPIAHLDPIGFIMILLFRFGYAKPVPVNPFNLREVKHGMLLVSLAGPAANVITALLTLIVMHVLDRVNVGNAIIFNILMMTYILNLNLAVFNLIPLPPLDGSQIVASLLPARQAYEFQRLIDNRWALLILFALLYLGMFSIVISPIVGFLNYALQSIVSIFFGGGNLF